MLPRVHAQVGRGGTNPVQLGRWRQRNLMLMLSQKRTSIGTRRATSDRQTETPVRRILPRVPAQVGRRKTNPAQLGRLRQRSFMLLLLQKEAQVGLRRANQVQLGQQRAQVWQTKVLGTFSTPPLDFCLQTCIKNMHYCYTDHPVGGGANLIGLHVGSEGFVIGCRPNVFWVIGP